MTERPATYRLTSVLREQGEKELAAMELQESIQVAASQLAGKSRSEKVQWSKEKREEGNKLYREQRFTQVGERDGMRMIYDCTSRP